MEADKRQPFTVVLLRPTVLSGNRTDRIEDEVYVGSVRALDLDGAIRDARAEVWHCDLTEARDEGGTDGAERFKAMCQPKDYDVLCVFTGHPKQTWLGFQAGVNDLDRYYKPRAKR